MTLLWGIGFPIMKVALQEIPVWTFRTLCLVVGGGWVLLVARLGGSSLAIPRQDLRALLVVTGVNVVAWNVLSGYGILLMEAGRAAIIAYTMPVWATILARCFLGERIVPVRVVGLLLGIAGLFVLIGPDLRDVGKSPWGVVFMLLAAVSWAGGTVLIKYYSWGMSTLSFTGWQLVLGGVPFVIGAALWDPVPVPSQLSWKAWLATGYVVFLGVLFGYYGWMRVVQIFPASVASIGTLTTPVIGVFSSAWLLGEPVTLRELAALTLVVTGLAIVVLGAMDGRRVDF